MAIISRQTGLLSAENWKKIYQTFREADFTAYDFETLRKSMIDYIKLNYPEDFNDFTESSEFVALIDLIAFFGQSLAFRTDLNARENFIDTAERRDSVLKLARLISYNPKRAIPASGLLKIDSISTTENVYDSDGIDLSNAVINWNDAANDNWLEQFTVIVNATLVSSQIVGRPGSSKTVNNILSQEYGINVATGVIPVYRFDAAVEGQRTVFEAVSASLYNQNYVYESAPDFGKVFNILYRNDRGGNSSNNTGFFVYFKQGELTNLDFAINEQLPNKVVNINVDNINDTDVWLYSLDSDGNTQELWQAVPATSGINVVYNTRSERNLYQVNSRSADQISLVFGDGSFSNIPQGNFRLYYRTSNGLTYRITPDEIRGIAINIDYVSRTNRIETMTMRVSLRYTVANANARESVEDIKEKAPQQYYTQNRMITGEDYNILPYTSYSTIRKSKAINRTSSGLSRYLDILDTTGKYSSTNSFGSDGVLYSNTFIGSFNFNFTTASDILSIIYNKIIPDVVGSKEMLHYYYSQVTPQLPIKNEVTADKMVNGEIYTISSVGSTDFTVYGAPNNLPGLRFTAVNAGNRTRSYTVSNSVSNVYSFSGNVSGNNPNVIAKVGDTLLFTVTAPGHPFFIKTVRTAGNANVVTTGTVANNGVASGLVTWDTTGVTPGTYFYVSQNNVNLSGNIIIESFGTGVVTTLQKWQLGSVGDSMATGYFSYNSQPSPIGLTQTTQSRYLRPGALVKFTAPNGYYFNASGALVPGARYTADDTLTVYAAIVQLLGDGTNNGLGLYTNGTGPVILNTKVASGAIIESIVPAFRNNFTDDFVDQILNYIEARSTFGLRFDSSLQSWQRIEPANLTATNWWVRFVYNSSTQNYTVSYRHLYYVFHSPEETNFYFDPSQTVYDSSNNRIIQDYIKILRSNSRPDYSFSSALSKDSIFSIYKNIVGADGYTDNKTIYISYTDSNFDSVPDSPYVFENVVEPSRNPNNKLVFFELIDGYERYTEQRLVDNRLVVSNYSSIGEINEVIGNFDVGQLFYITGTGEFRSVTLVNGNKVLSSALTRYRAYTGRQNLYYQYRHNSSSANRVDPSISNIIDLYLLTNDYDTSYRRWLQDTSNTVIEPDSPTSSELSITYGDLNNLKSISDTVVFQSAVFKPIFGSKSVASLQATIKVVKNPSLNITDADIKTSVIAAINTYFDTDNWDFGENFYFSELSAYLHKTLSPNVASIVIVPKDPNVSFGTLYQINAEPNELIISSATVDDVEIISALTAAQLNQSLAATS